MGGQPLIIKLYDKELKQRVHDVANANGMYPSQLVSAIVKSHLEFNIPESLKHADMAIEEVCSYYSVSKNALLGPLRQARVTLARHVAYYILERMGFRGSEVARMLDRDQSTVRYGQERIKEIIELNKRTGVYQDIVNGCETILAKLNGINTTAERNSEEVVRKIQTHEG